MTVPMVLTEAGVLAVFLLGFFVSRRMGRRWHVTEIAVMYVLGLLFEVLTAYMWKYHNIFLTFDFHVAKDISVLFPLGWAGLIMTATPLAEYCWSRWKVRSWWVRHLVLMGCWLVVGDSSETIFYNAGMIEYVNNDATELIFIFGQVAHLPPTMVLVGYALLQPFVSHFFRWLEVGLGGVATRRA